MSKQKSILSPEEYRQAIKRAYFVLNQALLVPIDEMLGIIDQVCKKKSILDKSIWDEKEIAIRDNKAVLLALKVALKYYYENNVIRNPNDRRYFGSLFDVYRRNEEARREKKIAREKEEFEKARSREARRFVNSRIIEVRSK